MGTLRRSVASGGLCLLLLPAGPASGDTTAPAVRRLPGNKPCPYPEAAQKAFVAGPVSFVVQVRPDGSAAAVEVPKVPLPKLGFEETIRACVAEWRFEPAASGSEEMRRFDGQLRYRLDATEEAAIRALLESLAVNWNARDPAAVEELALQRGDVAALSQEERSPLREQLQSGDAPSFGIELAPDLASLRFMRPDLVALRQPYRRTQAGEGSDAPSSEDSVLDAIVARGARGWRFVKVSSFATAWLEAVRVGGTIQEPRKVKNVSPKYPEYLKESRVQGVVILECVISTEGKVTTIRVLRGVQKGLDDAAIAAVRKWEYTPTLLEGKPVPVLMTITVNFRLN